MSLFSVLSCSFVSSVLLLHSLKSVIGMGTGAGAYILTRFAVSVTELP